MYCLLSIYYSDPISEKLLVKDVVPGLACVNEHGGAYRRISVKEDHLQKWLVTYVDLGMTVEINKNEMQLKHLLNYFAEPPCMTMATRLAGVEFKLDSYQIPSGTLEQLRIMCQAGPFYVEPHDRMNGVLFVKIFDDQKRCLNDAVITQGLAVYTEYERYYFAVA